MGTQIWNHLRADTLMSLAVILCENAWDDENSVINVSLGKSEVRVSTWQVYKKCCYYCILTIISVRNCITDNEHGYNRNSFIIFIFLELPVREHSWLRTSHIKASVAFLKPSVLHNLGSTSQNCCSDMTGVETSLVIASPNLQRQKNLLCLFFTYIFPPFKFIDVHINVFHSEKGVL